MTRAIFLVLIFAISALADNLVWKGKALDYRGGAADLYVGLDGFNDLETALKAGSIGANKKFSFELPQMLPEDALSPPIVDDSCGDATAGLRLGTIASVIVKDDSGVIGQMMHTSRRIPNNDFEAAIDQGDLKLTAWFYANRTGFIKEDCIFGDGRQVSDVKFQKGWNVLTAYFTKRNGNRYAEIRNGYTEGMQRWFFMPQRPDPQNP